MTLIGNGSISTWIWNNSWMLVCAILALGVAWGVQSETIDSLKTVQVEIKTKAEKNDSRIQTLEQIAAAQQEINKAIRDALTDIKDELKSQKRIKN